jgi:hypothetical protein
MPPETKPTISSLAEMTCENCVYLIRGEELIINPGQSDEHTVNRADCYLDNWGMTVRTSVDFCSQGKWVVYDSQDPELQDESETHPTSYDNCYYLFGRGK